MLLRYETAAFVAGLLDPVGVRAISKVSSSIVHKTHYTSQNDYRAQGSVIGSALTSGNCGCRGPCGGNAPVVRSSRSYSCAVLLTVLPEQVVGQRLQTQRVEGDGHFAACPIARSGRSWSNYCPSRRFGK